MSEKITPEDKFSKHSVVVKELGVIAKALGHLEGKALELAILGIIIGLILGDKANHFELACLALTVLGIAKVVSDIYAQITQQKYQKKTKPRAEPVSQR